jgi:heptose I phosphotransferase
MPAGELLAFDGKMTSAGPGIITEIDHGVCVNSAFRSFLTENRLDSFESFMSITPQEMIKKVRDDRHTARVILSSGGTQVAAYLKVSVYSWLRNFLRSIRKFTLQRGSLVHEYENLVRLREIGVPSITPIAAGTRRRGFRCESFLLTADLGPTCKLEDFIPVEFDKPFESPQREKKLELVRAVARMTRAMHEGGVNHRDYYLCHIHVLAGGQPWPQLYVIDLNRADRRGRVGLRWRVKDLAALHYSAPGSVFSRTDRLRFLKSYLGLDNLGRKERGLVRRIVRKSAQIARHAERSKARDREYMEKARESGRASEADCRSRTVD